MTVKLPCPRCGWLGRKPRTGGRMRVRFGRVVVELLEREAEKADRPGWEFEPPPWNGAQEPGASMVEVIRDRKLGSVDSRLVVKGRARWSEPVPIEAPTEFLFRCGHRVMIDPTPLFELMVTT